jgi:hypothetical protein
MKLVVKTAVLVVILAILYLAASPFVTLYQIKQAVDAKDMDKVATYIDFDVLQKNLSEQVQTQTLQALSSADKTGLVKRYEKILGQFTSPFLEKISDQYVTDETLKSLMFWVDTYQKQKKPAVDKPNAVEEKNQGKQDKVGKWRWQYKSFDEFVVWLPKGDIEWELQFKRHNWIEWRLSNVVLPSLL